MRTLRTIGIALTALLPTIALAQGTGGPSDFIPLLPSLPGIGSFTQSSDLAPFLANLYKICIGAAAVLAVLQIIRAGVLYMGGDSITEKKEARDLITLSIVGLILVLSPVIVFNIINPEILKLNINASSLRVNLQQIQLAQQGPDTQPARDNNPGDLGGSAVAPNPTAPGCESIGRIGNGSPVDPNAENGNQQVTCCASQVNQFSTCSVQQQTRSTGQFYTYCGCSFNTNRPTLTYYTYLWFRYVNNVQSQVSDPNTQNAVRDQGNRVIAPGYTARYADYKEQCRLAGGHVTEHDAGVIANLTDSQYVACPADAQVNTDHTPIEGYPDSTRSYTTYKCVRIQGTCESSN